MSRTRWNAGRLTRVAVGAALAVLAVGLSAPRAYAATEPALAATLAEPVPVTPGGSGVLTYEVTNASRTPTEGILLNVALPRYVGLRPDPHCRTTGFTPDGGTLISCNFSDQMGRLSPGEKRVSMTPYTVSEQAPGRSRLGRVGALVVPLENGEPTEDWHKLDGRNVAWAPITTS